MIQLQALNHIIKNKDVDFLMLYSDDFYSNYKDEFNFILQHYNKYKTIPDASTILDKFEEFTIMDISESRDYLIQRLHEELTYNATAKAINETDFTKDAVKAHQDLLNKLLDIPQSKREYGIDIVKSAKERYDTLIDKQNNEEAYMFSTGLNELDMSIDGLQRGEELVVVFARTNNCKSWIAEKLAVSVWEEGYNVGFFSPEMSPLSVGYRFDTLHKHFDNKGILGSNREFDPSDYKKYVDKLTKKDTVFSVTTPMDFNKNVTVSAIKQWVTRLDLKMIVIDGITYMKNERSNGRQNTTERLTDISEDLMTLSVELGIPIVIVVQANREAARDKDGEVNDDAPELDTIRGSDGISHNASKVISVVHRKETITLYINKNRNGQVGQKLIYNYDVNTGTFTYIDNPKSGLGIDTTTNTNNNTENEMPTESLASLFNDSGEL
jgi:replicative DNA helicase